MPYPWVYLARPCDGNRIDPYHEMTGKLPYGKRHRFPALIPILGIVIFILFYTLASIAYPGGSWYIPHQKGFSLWHNYLCDMLDKYAINGAINTARPYAIMALSALFLGLFWLWYQLPKLFERKSFNQKIMKVSGLLSLSTISFLAFGNHDNIVRIAGILGVIALITCSIELHRTKHSFIFKLGIICILVFLINYLVYESGYYISLLPVIQKITFLLFILWFTLLDVVLYQKYPHP